MSWPTDRCHRLATSPTARLLVPLTVAEFAVLFACGSDEPTLTPDDLLAKTIRS